MGLIVVGDTVKTIVGARVAEAVPVGVTVAVGVKQAGGNENGIGSEFKLEGSTTLATMLRDASKKVTFAPFVR